MPFTFSQRHPDKQMQAAWKYAQLGLLVLPLWPLIGVLVLLLSCGQTWRRQYRSILHRPLNWGLAIFSVWLVITAGFAYDHSYALVGLFNFLPYFLVFTGYSALIQTPFQLRRWAEILVVTSVPVVIIGLGQMFWGWASHSHVVEFLWGGAIQPTGSPPGRMASIFMYANTLAGYLVVVLSLGLGLWIESLQTLTANRPVLRATWLRLGFLSVTVIGNLVALILTDSRNAWAIAVFIGLAFTLYQGWRWLVAGVAIATSCILGAAFGPPLLRQWLRTVIPTFFWARLTDQMYQRPLSTLRQTQWEFAWSLTQQHPWLGWGLRNFTPLYQAHTQVWLGHPHNFLLMLTAETGIPFAIFFCAWVSCIVIEGFQLLRGQTAIASSTSGQQFARDRLIFFSYLVAFLACVLCNLVDVTIFDVRLNSLGWLLLSAICGVLYHQQAIKGSLTLKPHK